MRINKNKWLNKIQLQGKRVRLEPLSNKHAEGVIEALKDGELWNLWYTSTPKPEEVKTYISKAIADYEADKALPFAVIRITDDKVIGSTRFMNADSKNKRLEVGTTWYAKSTQKTGLNTECKYLLLQYAFEILDCIAVEFRTHFHNHTSRLAIEKLGAKQDGILRNHQMDNTGCLRDSVVFSILNSEWETVKKSLEFKLNEKY